MWAMFSRAAPPIGTIAGGKRARERFVEHAETNAGVCHSPRAGQKLCASRSGSPNATVSPCTRPRSCGISRDASFASGDQGAGSAPRT